MPKSIPLHTGNLPVMQRDSVWIDLPLTIHPLTFAPRVIPGCSTALTRQVVQDGQLLC